MLLIAGKGHETGQIVGSTVMPFSDHDAVRAVLTETRGRMTEPLWQWDELVAAAEGRARTASRRRPSPASRSTRARWQPGDVFVALKAERDGHDFVGDGVQGGRGGRARLQGLSARPGATAR